MQKLADLHVFEGLQRDAHAQMNLSHFAVFNDYSDAEKQERSARIKQEIEQINQEIGKLETEAPQALAKMRAGYDAAMEALGPIPRGTGWDGAEERQYRDKMKQKAQEKHNEIYEWPLREMRDRTDSLHARIKEIRDNDPEGRYAVPCFAIEDKLNKFETQIRTAVEADERKKMGFNDFKGYQNMSAMAAFQ